MVGSKVHWTADLWGRMKGSSTAGESVSRGPLWVGMLDPKKECSMVAPKDVLLVVLMAALTVGLKAEMMVIVKAEKKVA